MFDQATQPTILVKKADGTTERITLAELKARQAGSKPIAVVPIAVPVAIPVVVPKIEIPHGLVIGPVEKKISSPIILAQDQILQTPLKTEDVKSLLHEEIPENNKTDLNISHARTDQVSKIISSFTFKIPAQFENRLISCVQLRLKDIRSEADTRALCLRSIKDGGLGMTQTQVDEVIAKTNAYVPSTNIKKTDRESAVDKIIGQTSISPEIVDLINTKKIEQNISSNPIRPKQPQSMRPMVHDVQDKPSSMSPLDEIQYFTLVDLRRLSSQPTEAVNRLKQKFINLKDESYLLFMDSWNAWHNSPLYQTYLDMIDEAMSQKLNLSAVLNTKEKITLAEVEALIKMEKELDI